MKKSAGILLSFIGVLISSAQSYEINRDSIYDVISQAFIISNKGEYSKAYKELSSALEYGQKYQNDSIIGDVYNVIGGVFYKMKDLENAEKYYTLSKEALLRANYRSYLIYYYNNMAILYFDKGDMANAEKHYIQSRDLALELKDYYKALYPTYNIGQIKYNLGDYKNAKPYLLDAIKLYKPNTEHKPGIIIIAHIYMANIYADEKNYSKTLENFALAETIALEHDAYNELIKLEKNRTIFFEKLNQYDEVRKSMANHISYLEKSFKIQKNSLKEQNQLQRDLFEKESSLYLTQEINKSQEKSLKKIKLYTLSLLSLFFVTVSVVILLYRLNKNRLKLNKRLTAKNKELLDAKDKAEYVSQLKTNFFSTISHEFRTPLYAVTGITDILINESPKKHQIHYLNALKSSGEHLLSIINNILQINKYDANKTELNKIEFDIADIINNLDNSLKYLKKENNNKIHINIDSSIPIKLKGDSIKLSQIIINLLGNSLKFTENGNVWLTVTHVDCNYKIDKEIELNISIKDDGIGISEEMQARIFEDFYQKSVQLNRTYEGVGLGLAMVKRLLHAMGSEIYVESKPNEGAHFYFNLKFEYENQYEKIQINGNSAEKTKLRDKTVLVVDDNSVNQMITKRILETKEANVVVIDNGFDAIELVREQEFDIILMDIHMPKMNGYEATEGIREFNKTTPIIALTAVDISENKEKIITSGMNGFISKPFRLEQFYQELSKFIKEPS